MTDRGIALRHEAALDEPFLEGLYISVRQEELAPVRWPEEVKLGFLREQFRLQRHHYATYYRNSDFAIVTEDCEPIGRLYLFRGGEDLRIVDISLMPGARGRGIGTGLLQAVIAEAATLEKSISIHVEQFNPAYRLYRRLGFRETAAEGPYWLMECHPERRACT